jgi:hypothetical protein
VAQVPLSGAVFMSRTHGKTYQNLLRKPELSRHIEALTASDAVRFSVSEQSVALKAGTFGRWIAHVQGQSAFVICAPDIQPLPYIENSNLQVFSYSGKFPFYEMEVTSPLYALRVGESFHTQEKWLLMDLHSDEAVEQARIINQAATE